LTLSVRTKPVRCLSPAAPESGLNENMPLNFRTSAAATTHSGTAYDSPFWKRNRLAGLENDRHHGAAEKERTLLPASLSKRISAGRS
jgi:hypothetical protein